MKTAEDRSNLYQWWQGTIAKMMNYGMFYFTKANIQTYKNIIEMELCSICFYYTKCACPQKANKRKCIVSSI